MVPNRACTTNTPCFISTFTDTYKQFKWRFDLEKLYFELITMSKGHVMGTLFNSLLILSVLNYSGKNTRFIVFAKAYYGNSRYG